MRKFIVAVIFGMFGIAMAADLPPAPDCGYVSRQTMIDTLPTIPYGNAYNSSEHIRWMKQYSANLAKAGYPMCGMQLEAREWVLVNMQNDVDLAKINLAIKKQEAAFRCIDAATLLAHTKNKEIDTNQFDKCFDDNR